MFSFDLHLSGVLLILLAISLGATWLGVITRELQEKVDDGAAEIVAWRSLFPGPTWRTGEPSRAVESLFGPSWETPSGDRIIARDGTSYRVNSVQLGSGARVGWFEPLGSEPTLDTGPFLQGWEVGLGMDEGEESHRIRTWLEAWGAVVSSWGTLPPREGPFPSVLIWAREPSILAVWRETDLARRRCRWVQIGGAKVEGPHLRLERPVPERKLREGLTRLLSIQRD